MMNETTPLKWMRKVNHLTAQVDKNTRYDVRRKDIRKYDAARFKRFTNAAWFSDWCETFETQKEAKVACEMHAEANPPLPTVERVGYSPEMGRSRLKVKCVCGAINYFYAWSWAGHGKARCIGCAKWISYYDLKVKS